MKKRIMAVVVSFMLAVGCFSTVYAKDFMQEAFDLLYEWVYVDGELVFRLKDVGVFDDDKTPDYQGETEDWDITQYYVDTPRQEDEDVEQEGAAHLLAQYPKHKVIRIFNIEAPDAEAGYPVEVTIADTAVKAGKNYLLIHMDVDTGEWSSGFATIKSVQNGLIKANVTDSAPYALLEKKYTV